MEITQMYEATILSLGAMSLLMFCQVVVADIVGIRSKHVPGTPIPSDHSHLLFRVSRTVSNTSENIGIFFLAVIFCLFSNASPTLTAYAAWGFVISRSLYAVFYYSNLKILRSISFGASVLALLALIVIGFTV